jgi:hypothetical protein
VLLIVSTSALNAAATNAGNDMNPIRVFIDGDRVIFSDQEPVIVKGRTLVPMRTVFEAMNGEVEWEPSTKRVTIRWQGSQVAVFVGSTQAWVNGMKRTLDVPPVILNDRTMIPLRFIAESFGLSVDWEGRYRAVIIGMSPPMAAMAPHNDFEMPCRIRVQMNPMNAQETEPLLGTGYPLKPTAVPIAEYVADVLAHEMGDAPDPDTGESRVFTFETLKAGAMAILMYGWFHAWNPAHDKYDLNNSRRYQVYIPGKRHNNPKYGEAVRAVWGLFMVKKKSVDQPERVFASEQRTGRYNASLVGPEKLSHFGALYLEQVQHKSWRELLHYYYRNVDTREHLAPCPGLPYETPPPSRVKPM